VEDLRLRRCGVCGGVLTTCRACDRGRRYCVGECAASAERTREKRAGERYRKSAKGKAKKAAQGRARRERQKASEGDRRRDEEAARGTVRCQEVAMPEPKPTAVAVETTAKKSAAVEWRLVYGRAQAREARALLGECATCWKCKRRGLVVEKRAAAGRRW
jgi:hypothetical protein